MKQERKELIRYRISNGDYGDFYLVSKKEAETQLKNAEIFIEEIRRVIDKLED